MKRASAGAVLAYLSWLRTWNAVCSRDGTPQLTEREMAALDATSNIIRKVHCIGVSGTHRRDE